MKKLFKFLQLIFSYKKRFKNVRIAFPCLIRGNVSIGKYTYLSSWCDIRGMRNSVIIGKYCSFASRITIISADEPHAYDTISSYPFFAFNEKLPKQVSNIRKDPIIIGNDVWVGVNSIILPGVTIGNGAVIGAGSVVTKNVLPYSIVAGVPAKLIKMRFSPEIIKQVEELQWWDKSPEELIPFMPAFYKPAEEGLNIIKDMSRVESE